MSKIKGVKVIKTRRGKPKQLIIDIDKHYDVAEDLLDVIIAEESLLEPTIAASDAYKKIESRQQQKQKRKK